MIKRLRNASLQTKIMILLIFIITLLSAIFGIMFYNNTVSSALKNKEKEISTLASLTSNKIERFLFERSADIKVLSESKIFTMPEVSQQTRLDYLNNVVKTYKTYDSVFVLDLNGQATLSAGVIEFDSSYSNLKSKFLSGQPFISDIIISSENSYSIFFSEPLFDNENILSGAIVERMNFNSIFEIINDITFGETGFAYLKELGSNETIKNIKGINHVEIGNKKYLTSTYPLIKYSTQENQWVIIISQEEDEALSVKNDIKRYFGYVIFTSLLVFYFLSAIISRTITKPIRLLMEKTRSIMINNNQFASDVITSDEVKNLTSSFDLLLDEMNFMMQKVLEKSGEAAYIEEVRNSIELLFDHIPNGIITIDNKGYITSVNNVAIEILDTDKSNLVDRYIGNQTTPFLQPFFTIISKSFKSNIQLNEEICKLQNTNGKVIPIVFSTLNQTDRYDNLIGITIVINNLDAKKKFEESILRAKRLTELGELSAGVAHEIRNPLASIRGYAQLALRELTIDDEIASDIAVILLEVDRLDQIIERFMNFASPSKPNLGIYHMNDIITDTIRLISQDSQTKNIHIKHRFTTNDSVKVDYQQIKQVLLNLILNAIQSMPGGGHLDLVTLLNEKSGTMEIHIIDEGHGIGKELLEKIFTPFFTTRDKGSGLGLSICSRIVENHKGIIQVNSTINKGTQIIVKLPIEKGV